jgi:hypothetical protein
MQNKKPRNKQGQAHGLWEVTWYDKTLHYNTNFINGRNHGLCQWYNVFNELLKNEYYAR